jgi:PKD repeat protein
MAGRAPALHKKKWPPIANLTLVDQTGLTVTLSTLGTQPGAIGNPRRNAIPSDLATYQLTWGDGNSVSGLGMPPVTLTHPYASDQGSATALLLVTDSTGLTDSDSVTVTGLVDPTAPTPPVIQVTILGGNTSDDLWIFDVEITGTLASSSINFGDGSPTVAFLGAMPQNQTHTYAVGPYTVTVIATGLNGLVTTATLAIVVNALAPTAALTFVSGDFTGSPVTVSTAGTSDPYNALAIWDLDWDDGSAHDGGVGAPPATIQHTYVTPNTFTATLIVTNAYSLTGTVTMPILVQAPVVGTPPVATLTLNSGTTLGDSFVFGIDGSDPDLGAITWILEYGDGTSTSGVGGDLPTTRARLYAAIGSYTATFRVTDIQNLTTTKTVAVVVAAVIPPDPQPDPNPPTAVLVYLTGQFIGEPVSWSTAGTIAGTTDIVSWTVAFGDGQTDGDTGFPPSSLTNTYVMAGTYPVVFTVTDTNGLIGTATVQMVILAVPDPAQPPQVTLTLISGVYVNGLFTVAVSAVSPVGITQSVFNWGDGSGNLVYGGAPPATISKTFTAVGTYTTRLTATDTNGLSTTITLAFFVTAAPLSGSYAYYNTLIARPDLRYAYPLRSAAEIASYQSAGTGPGKIPISYDPSVDAGLVQINPTTGSTDSGQKFLPFEITTGDFFLTWDFIFDNGFAYVAGRVPRHKTWRTDSVTGSPIWLSFKTDYKNAADAGQGVGEIFFSIPSPIYPVPGQSSNDTIGQEILSPRTARFFFTANTLTRYWVLFENFGQGATPGYVSVWAADTARAPVMLYDHVALFTPPGTEIFRLEYDTSTDSATNGLMRAWQRNVVVLNGVAGSLTQAIVAPLLVQP